MHYRQSNSSGTANIHAYRQSNSSWNSKHACMQWKYILVVVQHNARLEQIMLKQTMAAAWHNQIIMWANNWIWVALDHSKECASSVHSPKNEWIDIDLLHCTIQGEQTSSRHQSYLVYVKKCVIGSKPPYQKQIQQALLEGALQLTLKMPPASFARRPMPLRWPCWRVPWQGSLPHPWPLCHTSCPVLHHMCIFKSIN